MRRSLLLRLLGLSLAVASVAVAATAWLAAFGTGNQLRDELERDASLLETDSGIRAALLGYAREHRGWAGVEALVRELAEQTGRRIALTTSEGVPIVDSARLLGQDPVDLPSVPAATIDATDPGAAVARSVPASGTWRGTGEVGLVYQGWQLTEQERRHRAAVADAAADCLQREAPSGPGRGDDQPRQLTFAGLFAGEGGGERRHNQHCVPDELSAPSAAAREVNERAVERTTACLGDRALTYQVSFDPYGMHLVTPPAGAAKSPEWAACEQAARIEALRPYVAPAADLYLGTRDRFDPLSAASRWRTAGTAAIILLVAAAVTVLAGRRLVRPIHALTAAAQRMAAGDRGARVPVHGNDEVSRLAAAFNTMAEAIGTSDRQRKDLVSDVAHELRTPLANVRSQLEAAEDGLVPLDTALIRSLHEEAALLERLVADLQDLALADAGMLRIHPEECDAADLVRQAVSAHRARAEASGITVRIDAPEPVELFADPARLRQALGNLVSNAVRHTPAGGAVKVAVRGSGAEVVFTVTDTGPGIAAEHLPHVFDRFYRAEPSRSRATGGSGLGLAITKHLVEAHHGRVDVASAPGEGATFTIRLPRSTESWL
jgi:two-component system sensor histidine kinase BaeS